MAHRESENWGLLELSVKKKKKRKPAFKVSLADSCFCTFSLEVTRTRLEKISLYSGEVQFEAKDGKRFRMLKYALRSCFLVFRMLG